MPGIALPLPIARGVYAAPRGIKPKAFAVALVLHLLLVCSLAVKCSQTETVMEPSAAVVVSLLPLASPSEPQEREAEKPVEDRKNQPRPSPPDIRPIPRTVAPQPVSIPIPAMIDTPRVDPPSQPTEAAAPKAMQAPPAPTAQSNAPNSWEGRVLARLQKYRRYPAPARSLRQQGVVYITFRLNRRGQVLSSTLLRSSGFPALDQAALDTLRRADPLPPIPSDRPDELELSVPVEFFVR